MRKSFILFFLTFFAFAGTQIFAQTPDASGIIYVKEGATGNGSSWANAYGDLQKAIDASGVSQVWVAKGTYNPTTYNYFNMKHGVKIYGGFPDSGTPGMAQRDWKTYETILSNNQASVVVADSNGITNSDRLDGFTITDGIGMALHVYGNGGGGISVYKASPSFANLKITGNQALFGGGVMIYQESNAHFYNCEISDNIASTNGGGMQIQSDQHIVVANTIIKNNKSSYYSGGVYTGIVLGSTGSVDFLNCLIVDNEGPRIGGLHVNQMRTNVVNSTIAGNVASSLTNGESGGIRIFSSMGYLDIVNSIVFGNKLGTNTNNIANTTSNVDWKNSYTEGTSGWIAAWGNNVTGNLVSNTSPFVNLSAGNFALSSASSAIDAGSNSTYAAYGGLPTIDLDIAGNPRLVGSTIDMGAYEYSAVALDTLYVHPAGGQTKIYGQADPTLTYVVSDTSKASLISGTLSRDPGENVGIYQIKQGTLTITDPNYVLVFDPAYFQILPTDLTIKADAGQHKLYGQANPTYTYVANGFKFTDNPSILSGSLGRASGEDVGLYPITQGSLSVTTSNYNLVFLSENFEITPTQLTVRADTGQFKIYGTVDPTFTYTALGFKNGDNISIMTGALTRTSGENVGLYPINKGTVSAGDNYFINYIGANFAIRKATISGITFENDTFTYDGTVKSLAISGMLPSGTSVTYSNNNHTDAGDYVVEANINGGLNYHDSTMEAHLVILKAAQTINFPVIDTLNLEYDHDFQLKATASSGLPVFYTYYDMAESIPAATVTSSGWVTLVHSGMIEVTAYQMGDSNYLSATPVMRVLYIESGDATIHDLSVDDENVTADGKGNYFYYQDCADLRDSVVVKIETEYNATVTPSHQFTIHTPKAGIYKQDVTVISQNGKDTIHYTIVIERAFSFKDIVVQKFDNVLLVNNNPQTNGGYRFKEYSWFKDGVFIGHGQVYSAGNTTKDLLDESASYSLILVTENGETIHVCASDIRHWHQFSVQVYPNPVVSGSDLRVVFDYPEEAFMGATAEVYTISGQLVSRTTLKDRSSLVHMPQQLTPGSYMLKLYFDGKNQTFKLNVK